MQEDITTRCLQALKEGKIILCPTDGIPGLSFHPNSQPAQKTITKLKGRTSEKKFLGLCHSLPSAEKFWLPLPSLFKQKLMAHWPGPLTVIWRASPDAPSILCSEQNENSTIALRVVRLAAAQQWFNDLLCALDVPLPSTSVNVSGESPIYNWQEACSFLQANLKDNEYFIPGGEGLVNLNSTPAQPSTIISLNENGTFKLIRQGAFDLEAL